MCLSSPMFIMHDLGPQLPHVPIQSPLYYKYEFNVFCAFIQCMATFCYCCKSMLIVEIWNLAITFGIWAL
jgi:hypothetical protein